MGYSPRGRSESDTTEQLHFHFSLSCIGEGNGNPLNTCLVPETESKNCTSSIISFNIHSKPE